MQLFLITALACTLIKSLQFILHISFVSKQETGLRKPSRRKFIIFLLKNTNIAGFLTLKKTDWRERFLIQKKFLRMLFILVLCPGLNLYQTYKKFTICWLLFQVLSHSALFLKI